MKTYLFLHFLKWQDDHHDFVAAVGLFRPYFLFLFSLGSFAFCVCFEVGCWVICMKPWQVSVLLSERFLLLYFIVIHLGFPSYHLNTYLNCQRQILHPYKPLRPALIYLNLSFLKMIVVALDVQGFLQSSILHHQEVIQMFMPFYDWYWHQLDSLVMQNDDKDWSPVATAGISLLSILFFTSGHFVSFDL